VQETLEAALATVLRLPAVPLTVAGRTDAGVHASGQVAHADVPRETWQREQERVLRRLAAVLPVDVRVLAVREVPADFDARFAATWRRYEYRLSDAVWGVPPLRRGELLWWPRRLDVLAMSEAAAALVGLHDFAAFCRHRAGATTVRQLTRLDVSRDPADESGGESAAESVGDASDESAGDPSDDRRGEIVCTVVADAFCHSMVRSVVGALLAVGEGRRPPSWPASLLARDRRASDVAVAPAHGLTLVEVGYPPDDQLAARAAQTRAVRRLPAPSHPGNPASGGLSAE
jgi:tRNA pseudouridine38-40 synthase